MIQRWLNVFGVILISSIWPVSVFQAKIGLIVDEFQTDLSMTVILSAVCAGAITALINRAVVGTTKFWARLRERISI